MSNCFPLNNSYSEISNNKYILNNNYTNNSYGLYDTSYSINYIIRNVSKNYPLTFYDSSRNVDISNIITYEPLNKNEPIIIYVSKGQDYSFNNNDYFRFYDTSFQLLNINHLNREVYDSSLTDVVSNFYFMNKQRYKFIATTDFCSNQPFRIFGDPTLDFSEVSLNAVDQSFIITIPSNASNNSTKKLFYSDNDNDVCGNLFILRDISCSYYYGDISFSIRNYNDFSNIKISLKSYNFGYSTISGYGNVSISNNDLFYYSESCRAITLIERYELLNKISAVDLNITNNTFNAGFNKTRHLNNSLPNIGLNYYVTIKDYYIIDISKNYPFRLLNRDVSNQIYIDETYQVNRLGIDKYNVDAIREPSGSKFYYGSLKIKVVSAFAQALSVQFISISNNIVDSSYIVSMFYETSNDVNILNHIVYKSNNSQSYYELSNSILQVKNQYDVYYNEISYNDPSNIFKLKLNTNYSELSYNSKDKLNNDLTRFVTVTPPVDVINSELSANFINKNFFIYYNVVDYENNHIQNIRAIQLNAGPFIEISNNYNSNNSNNSIFDFSINTNANANSYNFYDDIKVYIYDKSKNKVFIPFEINISGNYYGLNRTLIPLTNSYIFNTDLTRAGKYYSTFDQNVELNTNRSILTLNSIDASSITIDNSNSVLGRRQSISSAIKYFSNTIPMNFSDLSYNNTINQITLQRSDVTNVLNFNINNSFDASFIIYIFTVNVDENIDVSLGLSPTKFFLTVRDASLDTFTISGNFIKPQFFNNTSTIDASLIDLSYIGNYDLTIRTKSLSGDDFYRTAYSEKFFNNALTDIYTTYNIRVADKEIPTLTFFDITNSTTTFSSSLMYRVSRSSKFHILNDICFVRLLNFITSDYVDNKPLLLYNDNSIYNLNNNLNGGDLSFSVTNIPSNINFLPSSYELSFNNFNQFDASCIINYSVKDVCYNYSTPITLNLTFANIPNVRLLGQSIVSKNYIHSLSYTDDGLLLDGTLNYSPTKVYTKSTTNSDISTVGLYTISGSHDISFTKLGNYYFNYDINKQGLNGVINLRRLIKIIDTTKPYVVFPDLSFTIDGVNGIQRYNTISNIFNRPYLFESSANAIDISFTVNTRITDLSRVLYNFDLCDNYFIKSDLSYTISLFGINRPFVLSDISNYYSNPNAIIDASKQLNKVTYPVNLSNVNYLAPIIFKYTITDGCANFFEFNRTVNIIDEVDPTIYFNFSNYYSNNVLYPYTNYSYVQFNSLKTDFSYVAFNYTLGETIANGFNFLQEISSILLNFDISDNFGTLIKNPSNVTISISGSTLLPSDNKIINRNAITSDNSINKLFSKINSSFTLIYDISDNQNVRTRISRNVKIIEYIDDPCRNFLFGYKNDLVNTNSAVDISFGDRRFTIIGDISVNHLRLTSSDISYDISYRFVNSNNTISPYINSISGNKLYDPSALIYNLGPLNSGAQDFSHAIQYYPIRANISNINTYKILTVEVKNYGPIISFPQTNQTITHQSYTPISDASFIFGVTSISVYDEFYYYNYIQSISYSGTLYKVILDSSLNVNDPSSGTYNIIYSSRDKNNVDISKIRNLIVNDTQAPVIRSIVGDTIYDYLNESSNKVWQIEYNSLYKEYGANVYDSATKRTTFIDGSSGTLIDNSPYKLLNGIMYSISYRRLINTISYSVISLNAINTRTLDVCYQVIYSVRDLCNNEVSDNRIIKIIANTRPLLYPYIEIDISHISLKESTLHYLITDVSNRVNPLTLINKKIPSNGILDISYDLSLSFVNTNNNNIIVCEAIKSIVFKKMSSNYINFKLHAKSYDGSRNSYDATSDSSIRTFVDYSINSLMISNSPSDYQAITFYATDICQNIAYQQNSITLYLKIIDTMPPNIVKLVNTNFSDPNSLNYPLLSLNAITMLKANIGYFDTYANSNLNAIRYYKNIITQNPYSSNIVPIDPGITIEDIVDGSVNYINGVLEPNNSAFNLSDISLTYSQGNSYVDVLNILTLSGQYIQKYTVKDKNKNIITISRNVNVTPFEPIIRINYQQDSCGNTYLLYLTQKYDKFVELGGYMRDFSDIDFTFENVTIDYSNLNENIDGSYIVSYIARNNYNIAGTLIRNVQVYTPNVLEKDVTHNLVNLLTNPSTFNTHTKFTLTNGVYKFNVASSYAFTLVSRDLDANINAYNYDISNLISITSDSSFIFANEKYYSGANVILTVSGDFERCSIKFKDISVFDNTFKSYLKNNIFHYLFVYDNTNYFINLQKYYNDLRDNSTNSIATLFEVDISNLNNSISSAPPFFTINGIKQDLHLSYGIYRFNQSVYKNFYNKFRFSITPDGIHNGGVEYTKTVFTKNIPGISKTFFSLNGSYSKSTVYSQITINATTPAILYYYSENFRNMGGKIVIKNNIVFLKNTIILNSYVLTNQTDLKFRDQYNFLGISNEIIKNRIVLNQRFDVVKIDNNEYVSSNVNTISNINICCITQQNLQYNILYDLNQHPDRLIFKSYNDPDRASYIIDPSTSAISNLLDISNINSLNFNNSYITYFNSSYESSYSLIKTPALTIYDKSLKNLFYHNPIYNVNNPIIYNPITNNPILNNEIFNYINFFKNNNNIPSHLLLKDFSYTINEFLYSRPSDILNLDNNNIYNYYSSNNAFLLAPRIKITNSIDNYVMFSLDVNYKNVHFKTFEFLIYSARVNTLPREVDSISMDSLFFFNGSLVIANNLLYSTNTITGFYDGSSVLNKMHEMHSNRDQIIKNNVYLNIKDNSFNISICGITKQNIYNNMYLDESKNFIFHKYNENTIVNYQVNDENLTLAKTLKENSNNDIYLIDVCDNSFYNSFNNQALTNSELSNLINTKNYSIAITYQFYNEIDVSLNFNMLNSLYIIPLYNNNIPVYRRLNNSYSTFYNYNTNSYIINSYPIQEISINAINTSLYGNYNNKLHSNSYVINLYDYFDLDLIYNRLPESVLSTQYTQKKIIFTIVDISYNNSKFSLFDLDASFNIIYDKVDIMILNTMQIKLFSLNYKIQYLVNMLNSIYNKSYTPNNLYYQNRVNLQLYSTLNINYANDSFKSTLSTTRLNILYKEIFDNAINYITIYNQLVDNFKIYIYYVIKLDPIYNTYIFNSRILAQLVEDINRLIENIDNIIINENSKFVSSSKLLYSNNSNNSNIFTNYNDISNIETCLKGFYEMHNISQLSFKRLNVDINPDFLIPLYSNVEYINLFNIANQDPYLFLTNFKFNLNILNNYFNDIIIKNPADGPSIRNSVTELALVNVINFSQFIIEFDKFIGRLSPLIYNYFGLEVSDRSINYINNNFELLGSQILIHSKVSNIITLTINIKRVSYFYNYIDLSTIVLDVIIPDLMPPTLIFANNDISFNENDLVDGSINSVITKLIQDVSYIDLNQRYDLTLSNTYYSYYQDSTSELLSNNLINSLVSIDISKTNIDFKSKLPSYIDILYTIKDNANNINTIIRKILLNRAEDRPIFYYLDIKYNYYVKITPSNPLPLLSIADNITIDIFKAELTNYIKIVDPRQAASNSYLADTPLSIGSLNSATLLKIRYIEIYDVSLINAFTIPIAIYDVTSNKFIDFFKNNNRDGQELDNSSKILLNVGTYYLLYISSASPITNDVKTENRILNITIAIKDIPIITHCCYPKVNYKPIQDNYKLGSQNATRIKRAKYIINTSR